MGWLRTLLTWSKAPTVDSEPSVTFSHDIPTPVDDVIRQRGREGLSAAPVSRRDALTVPAVLRGRNLICSIATLPLVTRDRDRMQVRTPLLEQIDPNVANVVLLSQTVEDLILDAISWWRVTARNNAGFPVSAIHLDGATVSMLPPPGRRDQRTLPSEQRLPGGSVWVDGVEVAGRDMIRFDSPNPGILRSAARAIRRAILLERAAAMYARDPHMLAYFSPAEGADPVDDDEVQDILDDWEKARREHATGYVPAALKYNQVDSPSPADLQLAELQKQASIEIANALGLDSEDLQVSTTSRTYANATDRRRDRINDTLAPYMRAITDRLSMNDVTQRGRTVEWNLDDYMRADPTTRWNTYKTGLEIGVLSEMEVREMERLPAIPVEPRREDNTPDQEPAMTRNRSVRFSDDGEVTRISFDIPAADAEFRVDREKRTVSGLLIPWNKIAQSGFAKWRFAKDSLTWTETERVKLNREHDRRQAVAYAVRLQSTPKGLDGSFRVARGAAGDEVLSLAEDKVLDGFSIEADFDEDSYELSRVGEDEVVRDVVRARLVGVAITASPAFDDARVSRVAATRDQEGSNPMAKEPQATEPQATQPGGPDEATLTAFTTAVEAFSSNAKSFNDSIAHLVEVQQRNGEGPAIVDPTRPRQQFHVNEEQQYRFDGTEGKHDFSKDIIAGAKGDYEALSRVESWIQQNFAFPAGGAQFAVTGANVGSLNPSTQRPDLYVDQLEYPTPLWDSIRKGTIADNTPFVLPKFNTSSNLVGDHTEGTEPTAGAFTTSSQTITPSPVSGRVEVTREAWDQGGNPQLSVILWRQMIREYNEELESATATMLNGLTLTEIDLGAVDDAVLAENFKAALAALHFVRGGHRFRDLKMEKGLYTELSTAKDSSGRPLFPVMGASNADGMVGQFFGSLNIAGLEGVPTWALPVTVSGTPNVKGKSYLYNREDVHGWASNPQRLDFQYRVAYVDVAIWGYKALAATRTDGIRRVLYDSLA